MKRLFWVLMVVALATASQVSALAVQDVCRVYDDLYVLPGAVSNTVTLVATDAELQAGKRGDIVVPNVPMDADGKLSLENAPVYLNAFGLHAVVSVSAGSRLSATSADVTFTVTPEQQTDPVSLHVTGVASQQNFLLPNGGFEGQWSEVIPTGMDESLGGTEPAGWHSFASADGLLAMFVISNGYQFVASTQTSPASAGAQSALISSDIIFGQKANGNCTNGCINAGSMTADDPVGNYNYSDPSSTGFNTPFHGRPDSIVFWAKYLPADRDYTNEANKARMSAIITTDARYQDPEGEDVYANVKIATAAVNYAATPQMGWQRLAVPFSYTAVDPAETAYILVTFTTNCTPGGGSSYRDKEKGANVLDSVYVDDVELVYNRRLLRMSKGAEELKFVNNVSSLTDNYCDDCAAYTAEADGLSARTFIAFDAVHRCIFVYVIADDYAQTSACSVYCVRFADTDYEQGTEYIHTDSAKAVKVLHQGVLYILSPDGAIYNAQGARIK